MEAGCCLYMGPFQVAETLFEIELEGVEELKAYLEFVRRDLSGQRLKDAWETATDLVAEKVRELAPRDLGYLIASVDIEVIQEAEEFLGVVFSDEFYAPFQERGTDAYFPNIEALEEWAERHEVSAYAVALAIAARGIIPLRFFQKALVESEDAVVALIGHATGEIIEQGY